jgi:hypothetical protein
VLLARSGKASCGEKEGVKVLADVVVDEQHHWPFGTSYH